MVFCAVVGCGSTSIRDKISFFRIPSIYAPRLGKIVDPLAEERRKKWILALKRENLTESILKNQRICSKHFITGKPARLNDRNNPDWVPSVMMGYSKGAPTAVASQLSRKKRKIQTVSPVDMEVEGDINKESILDSERKLESKEEGKDSSDEDCDDSLLEKAPYPSSKKEKKFQCDVCKSYFARKGYLATHIRSHTGEKPFQCDVCETKFTVKYSLKRHMRIHTSEKSFKCEICDAKFLQKAYLNKHIKRMHGTR